MKKKLIFLQNKISTEGGYSAGTIIAKSLSKTFSTQIITKKNINLKNFFFLRAFSLFNIFINKLFFTKKNPIYLPALFDYKILNNIEKDSIPVVQYANEITNLNTLNKLKANRIIIFLHDAWYIYGIYTFSFKNNFLSKMIISMNKYFFKSKKFIIVASSEWLKKLAIKKNIIEENRIFCLPNPINTNFWKNNELKSFSKKKIRIDPNHFCILFIAKNGFDNFRKGGDFVRKLVKKYRNYSDIKFIVLGENASTLPKYDNVFYITSRDELYVKKIFLASDICLSIPRHDNIPLSLLQTMACGVPNVIFNTGGLTEVVDHKTNGWVCNKKNIVNISKGINFFYNNRKIYKKFSLEAQKKINLKHSMKKFRKDFEILFKIIN